MCGDGKEFKYKKEAIEYCTSTGLDINNIQKLTLPEPVENALHSVKIMLESIMENTKAASKQIFLTGEGNFREGIATILPYKGNRTAAKPTHYQAIKDYLVNVHKAVVVEGREADDALGIVQCQAINSNLPTIICSLDKDLDMIEGWHYNWKSGETYQVDAYAATKAFYTQMLTGDKTDNIQGLPGIGPAKAAKIIGSVPNGANMLPEQIYEAVEDAYMGYYNDMEEEKVKSIMYETGQLLWIGRELNEDNDVVFNPPGWPVEEDL